MNQEQKEFILYRLIPSGTEKQCRGAVEFVKRASENRAESEQRARKKQR